MNRLHSTCSLVVVLAGCLNAQTELWRYVYAPPGVSSGMALCASVVDSGIVVGGRAWAANNDIFVVSLTPSGREQWTYTYNGPGNAADGAMAMAADELGRVYLAGSSVGANQADMFAAGLDARGWERWTWRRDGSQNANDAAFGLALVGDDVYIGGTLRNSATGLDMAIACLSDDGDERWLYVHETPDSAADECYDVTISTRGPCMVGRLTKRIGIDLAAVGVTEDGAPDWEYRFTPNGDFAIAHAVHVGSDGNIYLCGQVDDSTGSNADAFVASLAPSGGERWTYRWQGPDSVQDIAFSIIEGSDGNIYVAAASGDGDPKTLVVLSFTRTGVLRWQTQHPGFRPLDGQPRALAAGPGELYIAYPSEDSSGGFAVLCLDYGGVERWVFRAANPYGRNDCVATVLFDGNGTLYATGVMLDSTAGRFAVVAIDPNAGIEEGVLRADVPRVSPVPTIVRGVLRLTIDERRVSNAELLDVSGRRVLELHAGSNDVSRLPSGVYFVFRNPSKTGGQAVECSIERVVLLH